MNTVYTIDLSLHPTTFDVWHVCLAGTVALLSLILIVLLLVMVMSITRNKKSAVEPVIQQPAVAPEPTVQIVEKIVEIEKIVHAPAPEPVILRESAPDAALQLLGLLQTEARFIDFLKEDITTYNDADIGVAARVVHEGCNKVLEEHFNLEPIRTEEEGNMVTLAAGFDAASVRMTGNIVGSAPFTGTLIHKGWQITDINLPKLTEGYNPAIISPAEVEL
jgi:hypothetical protein